MSERRIFWGRTLPQAIAKAARHYGVAPERLAWRRHEKRHGFVRHQRAVLVEVDPRSPLRAGGSEASVVSGAASDAVSVAGSGTKPAAARPVAAPAPPAARPPAPRPPADKIVARRNEAEWDAPDEESVAAALEACRRLLRFARIAAVPEATRLAERIEIELTPAPDAAAEAIGDELLDDLEHLLPRAVFTLCARRVRVGVDAFGRRAARAEELRQLAAAAGERVRASGEPETLEPMTPGERRTVHLVFEGHPELSTESLGDSHRKRVRISRRT